MVFEWDSKKEKLNNKNHGITFDEAILVFNDSKRLEILDDEHSTSGEERYNVIGSTGLFLVLFVVCTDRNGKTRLISARKATKKEEKMYYENYDTR